MTEIPKSLFDKLKRGLFMTHTEIIEKVKEALGAADLRRPRSTDWRRDFSGPTSVRS